MTNLEKIKQMTSEEIAKMLEVTSCNCCIHKKREACNMAMCINGIKTWLNSEVQEDAKT